MCYFALLLSLCSCLRKCAVSLRPTRHHFALPGALQVHIFSFPTWLHGGEAGRGRVSTANTPFVLNRENIQPEKMSFLPSRPHFHSSERTREAITHILRTGLEFRDGHFRQPSHVPIPQSNSKAGTASCSKIGKRKGID